MSRNLIDRDALIDAFDNTIKSIVRDALEDKIASYHLTLTVPFAECFKEIINKIEPVDAIEVVHGEWIEADDFDELIKGSVVCSNCRGLFQSLIMRNNEIELRANKTRYCPNCGAKMDGEVKNDGN